MRNSTISKNPYPDKSQIASLSTRKVAKIPVLTYHSQNIAGNTYATNDHVALETDLKIIHAHGRRIIPVMWVVEWVLGRRAEADVHGGVSLTFDDGTDFDYYDLPHPYHGLQLSFYNILRDFQAEIGPAEQPHLHATAFVIASPSARRDLCQRSLAGLDWWNDTWWQEANRSLLFSIHNHSWDHNLPEVTHTCEEQQNKGSFAVIDTYDECQAEIVAAAAYIHQKTHPTWPSLFAYPFGQSSEYLREEYFPRFPLHHRTLAAFSTGAELVTREASRWDLPRFVCGCDWKDPEGLLRILDAAR